MMRIVTWNVNSVRTRLGSVRRFLRSVEPDVLCLQETKVEDRLFPRESFRALGYRHLAFAGQKSYNGVAIVSRWPLTDARVGRWCRKRDCRHVSATLPGGLLIHNFYVPAGGPIPDPARNEKFDHKLRFLAAMARWFRKRRAEGARTVLVGDLNVAPLETDVWSHEKLRRVVTHTPVEVAALKRLGASQEWIDAVRYFVPRDEKLYTWWSYRAPDWKRVDKGRRLDHVWVTPALEGNLRSATVFKKVRGWKRASDHAPVMIELEGQ